MSDFFGTGAIFDFGSGSVGITFSSTSSISSDATKMAQVMLGPPVGQHKFNGMLESSNQNSTIINLYKFVSNPTAGTKKTSAELKLSVSFFWSFHGQATFEAAKWVTILSIAFTWIPATTVAPCPCHVKAHFTRLGCCLVRRPVNYVTCSQSCW